MARYLEEPDREVRQEAWELVAQRRLPDREAVDDIFDEMIGLRTRIARNAGFDNFRDYQFKAYERFDYTPDDCFAFHEAIEQVVVPAYREIQQERRRQLGVEPLRPWDLASTRKDRPPLRPFKEVAGAVGQVLARSSRRIDPDLGGQFDAMVKAGWLDLDSRKGKAPGGYQATYDETRHPFIFMNAVGLHRDVETLLHEGGHAFHAWPAATSRCWPTATRRWRWPRSPRWAWSCWPTTTSTCSTQGDDLVRARREQLEGIIGTVPVDRDHRRVPALALHAPASTRASSGPHAGWTCCSASAGSRTGPATSRRARRSWQRQLHLFGVPFYYIEYGIAQIGALQLWQNAREDKAEALRQYREALALGGSRPLPELWAAGGLKFDFSESTLRPLVDLVMTELRTLA